MKRTLERLKPHSRSLVTVVCAALMLLAYLALSPWVAIPFPGGFGQAGAGNGGFTPPAGFDPSQLPEGFDPSQLPQEFNAPEGFTPPAGFAAPEGFQAPDAPQGSTASGGQPAPQIPQGLGGLIGAPGTTGSFLVPLAAGAALLLTGWRMWKPRYFRLTSALIVVCGLLALVYYVLFFIIDTVLPIPISFVDQANAGFWLALLGSIGLLLQIFVPRFITDLSRVTVRELVPKTRRSGLSLAQNLSVALDALLANKMRSALTMLGIIIGVASVVSMISVGRGATVSVTEQISSTGLNLLTISPGGGTGMPGPGGGGGGANADTLTYADAEALMKELTGIDGVLPQYNANLDVRMDDERLTTAVRGVTSDYADLRNVEVEIGRFLTDAEYDGSARVAVLGKQAAEELFGGINPIGRDIRIENKRFEVIGVLADQDGGFGADPNLEIQVPLTTGYRQLFDARKTGSSDYRVTNLIVAVTDLDDVERVTGEIETVLRREHRLSADEENDFSIVDQQSLLDIASSITGILTVLLGAIASVSLLVGGIGIMNIMLVSVSERTKEIGLRKAIGARRGHISQQFLIETIFLSLLGGSLGVLLGVFIAMLVNASGVLNAVISTDSIALGLGFSALVGIFFGVYPANRAAALEPIEALRYE
ncbi:MAG: ABC transporter permease [Anaerolineae bacterium]|nr:ABC transporter permease [Anaerolineae bacterium]